MVCNSAEQPSQGEQMERKVERALIASENNAPIANVDTEDKLGGNQLEEETQLKQAQLICQYVTSLQFFSILTQLAFFDKFGIHPKQKEQSYGVQKDYLYDKDRFFHGQDLRGYQETDNKIDPLIPDALQQSGNQEEAAEQLSVIIQSDSLAEPVSKKYAGVHLEAHSQSSSHLKEEENKKAVELMKLIFAPLFKKNGYEKDLGKKEQEQNEKENINFTRPTHAGDREEPPVLPVEESALPSENTIEGLNKKNCLYPYPTNLHHYLSESLKEFLDYQFPSSQHVFSEGAGAIASSRHYDQHYEQEETSNPVFGFESSKESGKSLELGGESAQSSWIDRGEDIRGVSGGAPALKLKDDIEEYETNGIEKHFSKYDKRKNSADLSQGGPRRSRRGGYRLGSMLKRDVKGLHLSLKPDGIEPRLDGTGGDEQDVVPPMAEDPNASEAESRERTTEVDRVAAIQSLSVKDGDTSACRSLASETATDSTQQKEIHAVSVSGPDSQSGAASDITDVSGRKDDATEGSCGGVRVAAHDTGSEAPECSPASPVSQTPVEEMPVQATSSFEFFHTPVQVSSPGNSQHMSGTVADLEASQRTDSYVWEGGPPAAVQSEQGCSVHVSDCTDLASDSRAEEETLRLSQAPCCCTAHGRGEREEGRHAAAPHSSALSQPHARSHCSIQSERGSQSTLSPCSIPAESGEGQLHSFSSPSSQPAPQHFPPVRIQAASSLPPWAPQTARIDLTRAGNRSFVNLGKRRATYPEDWPNLSGIDAANVALSGFFFIGPGRRVRCFYCGLELDYLTSAHNIWDEHVRHSPDCPYLNAVMGSDFVAVTREKLHDKQN